MKVLQINVALNTGSTGRITEQLGETIMEASNESYVAYSRIGIKSSSKALKIGNKFDFYRHAINTRLFDNHGFSSKRATIKLLKSIKKINPDIIHLHNLHGYYLHVGQLFSFLKEHKIPVVWTFHDCWPFTGHCTYFDSVSCEKWKTECNNCPKKRMYPESWFSDNSKNNFKNKKEIFNGVNSMQIVTPSNWLKENVKQSFLGKYPISVIHNGVDLSVFKPQKISVLENEKPIILGVASIWDTRKGLKDFVQLAGLLDSNTYQIVLIGLSKKQIQQLPNSILGISRTENIQELASWYRAASVFVNPTYQDNFPTTNLEALACGTPVITYKTGGSPEAFDEKTGIIIKKGNIQELLEGVTTIVSNKESYSAKNCRKRAEKMFDKNDRFNDYLHLYKRILK